MFKKEKYIFQIIWKIIEMKIPSKKPQLIYRASHLDECQMDFWIWYDFQFCVNFAPLRNSSIF